MVYVEKGGRKGMKYAPILFGLAILLASVAAASATTESCAVVLNTPDGFLALRDGPGTRFRMKGKLRPGVVLLITTENCSWEQPNIKCQRWMRVVADSDALEIEGTPWHHTGLRGSSQACCGAEFGPGV
jgi:hypothetical protein